MFLGAFFHASTRFRHTFEGFVDARKGKNKHYSLTDAALSAFSVFFTQSPSFLDFQRTLELTHGNNNARTLFGVHEIPSDNQIRNLLDNTPPQHLDPLYSFIFNALDNASIIDTFHSFNDSLLVALDGVEYFSSKEIHCEHCSTRQHANGQITYSHTVLTPVVLKPSCKEVIPLAPEFILPQDGAVKQDCELNAGKRWLHRYQKEFGRHKVTLLGDDLYSHEPFCRDALAHGFDFIYVCKKSSHTTLYEWLDYLQGGDGSHRYTYSLDGEAARNRHLPICAVCTST